MVLRKLLSPKKQQKSDVGNSHKSSNPSSKLNELEAPPNSEHYYKHPIDVAMKDHDKNEEKGDNGEPAVDEVSRDDNFDAKESVKENQVTEEAYLNKKANETKPPSEAMEEPTQEKESIDEEPSTWDFIRIVSASEQIKCSYPECCNEAVAIWQSNKEGVWNLCKQCQMQDFGEDGKDPEEYSEALIPTTVRTPLKCESKMGKNESNSNTNDGSDDKKSTAVVSPNGEEDKTQEKSIQKPNAMTKIDETITVADAVEESYELKKIVPYQELLNGPRVCSGGDDGKCQLPACSVWKSTREGKEWYYCIDCQEKDFDGWPNADEMPSDALEQNHLDLIATKCSKKKNPKMPALTRCITPLPNTPRNKLSIPKSVKESSKQTAARNAFLKKKSEEMKRLGGKELILDRNTQKKMIFSVLRDFCGPMSKDQLYKVMKGEIPDQMLESVLCDMASGKEEIGENDFSDDDEDDTGKTKKDDDQKKLKPLIFKQAKGKNSGIYYVDETQIPEFTMEERQSITQQAAKLANDKAFLEKKLKVTKAETERLLSEPTNDEANAQLVELEREIADLKGQVESAQAWKVNKDRLKELKRKIRKFGCSSSKRKRLFMSGLRNLEECFGDDSNFSVKQVLKGKGPFEVYTDDQCIKDAVARMKNPPKIRFNSSSKVAAFGDPNFIGVNIDNKGNIERVYLNDDHE